MLPRSKPKVCGVWDELLAGDTLTAVKIKTDCLRSITPSPCQNNSKLTKSIKNYRRRRWTIHRPGFGGACVHLFLILNWRILNWRILNWRILNSKNGHPVIIYLYHSFLDFIKGLNCNDFMVMAIAAIQEQQKLIYTLQEYSPRKSCSLQTIIVSSFVELKSSSIS